MRLNRTDIQNIEIFRYEYGMGFHVDFRQYFYVYTCIENWLRENKKKKKKTKILIAFTYLFFFNYWCINMQPNLWFFYVLWL